MNVSFILNGEDVSVKVRAVERLSDVLKRDFGIGNDHGDCMKGTCGKCIIIMNGKIVPSCIVPAFKLRGAEIVTFEGFRQTLEYEDIADSFERSGAYACELCRSSKILAIESLLETYPRPDEDHIREYLSMVPCRCSTPADFSAAVRLAAEKRAVRKYDRAR